MANHSVQRKGSHSEGLIPRIFSSKTPTNTLKVPLNTSAAASLASLRSFEKNHKVVGFVALRQNSPRQRATMATQSATVTSLIAPLNAALLVAARPVLPPLPHALCCCNKGPTAFVI